MIDADPVTPTAPGFGLPVLDADRRSRLPRQLDELAAVWRSPDAWQGTTQADGVTLPGGLAGQFALNGIVVHGWDLARATGQACPGDPASLRASYELLVSTTGGSGPDDVFGPPVDVPGDAPLVDRVVALAGRRPSWTPEAP